MIVKTVLGDYLIESDEVTYYLIQECRGRVLTAVSSFSTYSDAKAYIEGRQNGQMSKGEDAVWRVDSLFDCLTPLDPPLPIFNVRSPVSIWEGLMQGEAIVEPLLAKEQFGYTPILRLQLPFSPTSSTSDSRVVYRGQVTW